MKRVMGGALRKWKGSSAVPQAIEKNHGRCYEQMEGVLGGAISKWNGDVAVLQHMKRVMGGAFRTWKGFSAVQKATAMGNGRCYKQMERCGALSK